MIPAAFDYLAPTSVEDALAALAEHGDDAKIIAGGVGVGQGPAEGATVPDLGVGEVLDRLGDERGVLGDQGVGPDRRVLGHRPDHDRVAVVADAAQRVDPAEVDDHLGRVEPHPEHREQALPAGQDLGLVPELGQGGERLLHRRGREVVELCGDHWPAPSVLSCPGSDWSKCGIAAPSVEPPFPPVLIAFHTRSGVHGIWMSLMPN